VYRSLSPEQCEVDVAVNFATVVVNWLPGLAVAVKVALIE